MLVQDGFLYLIVTRHKLTVKYKVEWPANTVASDLARVCF